MTEYIEGGKIINTHGIKGELKAELWLDNVAFLKACKRVFIKSKEYRILSVKEANRFILLKLEGIEDINTAVAYKETVFSILRSDAKLKKDKYFLSDIIGFKAYDENGIEIGKVTEIFENPANPIYVVSGQEEHMIPAIPEFIISTDLDKEMITFRMIEGL